MWKRKVCAEWISHIVKPEQEHLTYRVTAYPCLISWLKMASIMQGLLLGLVLAWLDPKSRCWNRIWIHQSTILCYYINKVIIHFCELLISYMKHFVLLLYDFCNVMERININLQLELDQENWTYIFNICRGRAEKDRIKRQQVIERCFQF